MNIGMGLQAANAFVRDQQRLEALEREKQRFDWEKRRALSEMSLLGDKEAAARAGYKDTVAESEDRAELRPLRADAARLGLEGTVEGLRESEKRRPIERETRDLKAETARDEALVSRRLAEVDVQDLPRAMALKRRKGILDDVEAQQANTVAIAQLVRMGDNAGIARFLNDVNETAPPDRRIQGKVAKVGIIGANLVGVDQGGQPIWSAPLNSLRQIGNPTKTEEVSKGATLVEVDSFGNTRPIYRSPEQPGTSGGKLPSEAQLIEYFISKGYTEDAAFARAGQLKQMNPRNAQMTLYQDKARNRPPRDDSERQRYMDEARKEVEMIFGPGSFGAPAPGLGAGSNTGGAGTKDPRIDALIGIK